MKRVIGASLATALAISAFAAPAAAAKPTCNWGEVTSTAIVENDFRQGEHASSFAGSRRAGLANVVNKGDLNALCVFIRDL